MRGSFLIVLAAGLVSGASAQENRSIDPAWLRVPEIVGGGEAVLTEPVMGSDIPVELRFVELLDGVYAPIGVRQPAGEGPFPTVVFAHMNGGYGLRWIREWTQYGSGTLEAFLDAGYAVVWMRYRAEVDTPFTEELTVREFQGRDRWSRGPLEYEDAIEIVEYVRALPDVDADRVGWLGVSHGGEMLLKVASEYGRAARRRGRRTGRHGLPGEPAAGPERPSRAAASRDHAGQHARDAGSGGGSASPGNRHGARDGAYSGRRNADLRGRKGPGSQPGDFPAGLRADERSGEDRRMAIVRS